MIPVATTGYLGYIYIWKHLQDHISSNYFPLCHAPFWRAR